jgi:hypothetical protein
VQEQAKHEGGYQRILLSFLATRHDAQVLVPVVRLPVQPLQVDWALPASLELLDQQACSQGQVQERVLYDEYQRTPLFFPATMHDAQVPGQVPGQAWALQAPALGAH